MDEGHNNPSENIAEVVEAGEVNAEMLETGAQDEAGQNEDIDSFYHDHVNGLPEEGVAPNLEMQSLLVH